MKSVKEARDNLWSQLFDLSDGEPGAPLSVAFAVEELIRAVLEEPKAAPTGSANGD